MHRRREVEVFSLSFLDCICCGFGAIILLLVLTEIGRSVGRAGVKRLVILNTHGGQPQVDDLEEYCSPLMPEIVADSPSSPVYHLFPGPRIPGISMACS